MCVGLTAGEPWGQLGWRERLVAPLAVAFNLPAGLMLNLDAVYGVSPLGGLAAAVEADRTFAGSILATVIRNDGVMPWASYFVPIEPFFFSTFALTIVFQLAFALVIMLRLAYRLISAVSARIVDEIAETYPLSAALFLGAVPFSVVLFAVIVAVDAVS